MNVPHQSRREVLAAMLAASIGAACSSDDGDSSAASAGRSTTSARPTSTTSTTSTVPQRRFKPGDRPDPSKPEGVDTLPEVEHIVIYMQENQSYDSHFGMLKRGDGFTLGPDGAPTNSNPGPDGSPVVVTHLESPCGVDGGGQNWNSTHLQVNGGAMDGFAKEALGSMKYLDGTDLPFYAGLAETFVLCDRWFASVPGQTHPNRRYLMAATSVGMIETSVSKVLQHPDAPNGTIWDRLNQHGISWIDYAYDLPDILLFPNVYASNKDKVHTTGAFLRDCASGNLPAVSIVSAGHEEFSEETDDIGRGEAFTAMVVNALMSSPAWEKTVLFFMYDEHGGMYDHVPPPAAIPPDDILPDVKAGDQPGGFDMYGIRIPAVVISPFAKKDYVSHVVHDHTSVLRFIETKWNLGAMTYRDANASNFKDCFDFEKAPFREPPKLPTPKLPDGVSLCKPGGPPLPTVDSP
ncbi:MAG: alkaline phosphatase family protein [Acidimicrobiales bacterium]